MSEVSDWALVALTGVLAFVTYLLSRNTAILVKITREVGTAAENLQLMPALVFNEAQPLSDGGNIYLRFSVKNVGKGHAKYTGAKARLKDGEELQVMPHASGNVINADGLFYWDVYGVKVGDEIEVVVEYTDLRDKPYPTFKHIFSAH
jgi:hypothetical protein